jgi:hypothetical protein
LVITPLLGFMINVLDTDRREQAKVNSEQEVQAALNYIAQDLQQAIYIYDAKGVELIKDTELRYPKDADKEPVLVFWKREYTDQAIGVKAGGKNDSFVYSLVAYYLIKNGTNDKIWSDQYRIARFQIKNGVVDPADPINTDGTAKYIISPDKGFDLFKLNEASGDIEVKMNAWKKKSGEAYTQDALTLIDFVDSSTDKVPAKVDCTAVFPGKSDAKKKVLRVPSIDNTTVLNNGSFYACVDIDTNTAKVFIRGNALARFDNNKSYDSNKSSYFPQASIQVKGKGFIGAK